MLTHDLAATLNQSRQSILEQSCSRLDQIEQCLLRNLKDAADDFDKKRQTAQELEEPIFEPIGMERLTIEDNHKGAGPDRIKKVLLGTNMEEFRNIASKSDRALEALWKEWTFVQEDILTLGVTVLGSEAMDFASLQGCRSMQTKLEASIEAFSKHKGSTTAVKERSDELIGQIDHVINDTIKKSRDQEKVPLPWLAHARPPTDMIFGAEIQARSEQMYEGDQKLLALPDGWVRLIAVSATLPTPLTIDHIDYRWHKVHSLSVTSSMPTASCACPFLFRVGEAVKRRLLQELSQAGGYAESGRPIHT